MDYESWKEALREIPIEDVCDTIGVERRGDQILCPEHNDTHFGSCKLFRNRYYCFACGARGDAVSLVMHVNGMDSWMEAAKWLASLYRIPAFTASDTGWCRLPFTKKQMALLNLIGGNAFSPMGESPWKPEYGDFEATPDGYLTGERVPFSLDLLFREDPEGFWFLVSERAKAIVPYFIWLYEAEAWRWRIFRGLELQKVLEYVLTECRKICFVLWEHDHGFPMFRFPEEKKHKSKYQMVY